MATDVFGDEYVSKREYARRIVTQGASLPFYRLVIVPGLLSTSVDLQDLKSNFFLSRIAICVPGLYCIYHKTECLYVGYSMSDIHYRLYRFGKELLGRSREDESHSGARKAREAGYGINDLYVKYIPTWDLPNCIDGRFDLNTIDETVAILLKSKFNDRKKY